LKQYLALIFLLIILYFFCSCTFFETRNPESPDEDGIIYVTPISPDITIENFVKSIKNKDVDNYGNNFADSNYIFVPSSNANIMFPVFFENWNLQNEKKYFLSLKTELGKSNNISINLSNNFFEIRTSDSVVFLADYYIFIDLPKDNYSKKYDGKLLFVIKPQKNGLWAITRWNDYQNNNSNITETFSFLKWYFHN